VELEASFARIEHGAVIADDPGILQRADTAPAGGGRHAGLVGKLLVGDATVSLQDREQAAVLFFHLHRNIRMN
jgi:hypothetical protein